MRERCNAKLGSEEKVMRFTQWINEIHNWGLGPWADGFLDDVEDCVEEEFRSAGGGRFDHGRA